MKIFKCHDCGYTKEAESMPEDYSCPVCEAGGETFFEASRSYIPDHLINEPADTAAAELVKADTSAHK